MVFICFGMLEDRYYTEVVGLYLLLLEYQEKVGHPHCSMLQSNLSNFVGEDIEIANRALSFSTKSIRGQTERTTLNRSYRQLGCILPVSAALRPMLLQVRSLRGWSQNKRLEHSEDEEVVKKGVAFMQKLLQSFQEGTFTHYLFPQTAVTGLRGPGRPPGSKNLPKGTKRKQPSSTSVKARINAKNVDFKAHEEKKASTINVPVFTEFNWDAHLKLQLNRLLKRVWRFGDNINPEELDAYDTLKSFCF